MNTLQDHELAEKIAGLLDQATKQIDTKTTDKLLAARKEALAHFQEKPAPVWLPEWAGAAANRAAHIFEPFNHNLRAGFALLALLASLGAIVAWQTSQQTSEIAEIDASLLTDELPINAYLDKGFDSWLKPPSR